MTLEPLPGDDASPALTGEPTPAMRAMVRRQLERHAQRGAVGPSISVLGVCGSRATVLRHGFDRPAEVVLGLVVPADFSAVLTVASSVVGRAIRLDHGHLAIGVDRAGTEVCMVATAAQTAETFRPSGWLVDACRRSLQLPTQPDCSHPLQFPLALWLDRLMVEIIHTERPVTWADARSICPVPARWISADPAQLGATLASITPAWARLRSAATAGGLLPIPIEPAHAAWMDDAMFARWCLGFFPDFDDLRADVEFVAPPAVAAAVAETVAAAHAAYVS